MRGRIVAAPQQHEIQPLSHVPPGVGSALAAFAQDGRPCHEFCRQRDAWRLSPCLPSSSAAPGVSCGRFEVLGVTTMSQLMHYTHERARTLTDGFRW
jgi:hypothetical protein